MYCILWLVYSVLYLFNMFVANFVLSFMTIQITLFSVSPQNFVLREGVWAKTGGSEPVYTNATFNENFRTRKRFKHRWRCEWFKHAISAVILTHSCGYFPQIHLINRFFKCGERWRYPEDGISKKNLEAKPIIQMTLMYT